MRKKRYFIFRRLYIIAVLSGINPILIYKAIIGLPFFIRDLFTLISKWKETKGFGFVLFPLLTDRFETNGNTKNQYFIQDLYFGQKVHADNPKKLVDWGSRVDGYVAHIACFRKIEVFDIRQQNEEIQNITFKVGNIMKLSVDLYDYCDAISSLHVFDNIGLGRYSDPVNPMGHIKAFDNIHKMLHNGGKFYFSTPIGLPQRIEFNANIVYSMTYLIDIFRDTFSLESFSYLDDNLKLHTNITLNSKDIETTYGCYFGLGMFVLVKK